MLPFEIHDIANPIGLQIGIYGIVIRGVSPTRCDVSQFIYFCKTLYMFQTGFPFIIMSSKLHMQRQAFVGPILLPAASLVRLAAGSSIGILAMHGHNEC